MSKFPASTSASYTIDGVPCGITVSAATLEQAQDILDYLDELIDEEPGLGESE